MLNTPRFLSYLPFRLVEAGEFPVVPRLHLVVELVCAAAEGTLAVERVAVLLREELVEVLLPAAAHDRAVGDDDDAAELSVAFADNLKRGQRLAEAHLRVPQHLVLLLEAGQRPVNRIYLLFTEYDRLVELQFATGDDRTALLHCCDRGLDCLQVRTEPLTPLRGADELVRKAGVFQDGMDLLVGEVFKHLRAVAKGSVADGEFGVQQLVFDARRLGLLVDACAGRVVQRLAVRRELVGHKR